MNAILLIRARFAVVRDFLFGASYAILSALMLLISAWLTIFATPTGSVWDSALSAVEKNNSNAYPTVCIVEIRSGFISPTRFCVHANREVTSVTLNDVHLTDIENGGARDVAIYDLGPLLQRPINQLRISIANNTKSKGEFYIVPTIANKVLILRIIVLQIGCLFGINYIIKRLRVNLSETERIALFIGVALRITYVTATPFFVRDHDFHGHMYYISYLSSFSALPPTHLSWETFQPPLYYLIGAGLMTSLREMRCYIGMICIALEAISCLISILILPCCIWISRILYDNAKVRERGALLLVCSVFPPLVFEASQINNDTLFSLLSFIFLSALLLFWMSGRLANWVWVCVLLGISLLEKTSALVLAVSAHGMLLFKTQLCATRRVNYGLIGVSVMVVLCGWFEIPRWIESSDSSSFVVGNLHYLSKRLAFVPTLQKSVTFNPATLLAFPFNSDFDVHSRREIFWEYYFKSAFFGQWMYDRRFTLLGRLIVLSGESLLPFVVCGWLDAIKKRQTILWPLAVLTPLTMLLQLGWVWKAPYPSSEDFRYFVFLIVPITVFVIQARKCASCWTQKLISILGVVILFEFMLFVGFCCTLTA